MEVKSDVLFITYYWPPSGGAGVQRSLKFVKYLPSFGIHPVVLTVDPDKATYPVIDESLKGEVTAGTTVLRTDSFEPLRWLSRLTGGKARIPHGGFTNQRKDKWSQRVLRFIRGNFFLPDARVGWVRHAVRAAARIITEKGISTVVISSPPHSSQLIGLELKRRFPHIKWVADLRDPWTDIYYYEEMHHLPFARKKDASLEKQVLERCDSAIVVSEHLRKLFVSKTGAELSSKFHVLSNGFDLEDFRAAVAPPSDRFTVTYVGTIADNYRPEVFIDALVLLRKELPESKIRLRFVGSPSISLTDQLKKAGLNQLCDFIPYVAHEEAVRYMRESSLLLLLIPQTTHDRLILTGKLFEYLGAGVPVVGIGPVDGDAASVLTSSGAGRVFDRNDAVGLSRLLIDYYFKWLQNTDLRHGRDVSVYERKALTKRLAEIIRSNQS
ncbi:MAG: glycosyltransferase [Bacteroidota bacterium]